MKDNSQNQNSFASTDIPGSISDDDTVLILGKPAKCALTVKDKVAVFSDREIALKIKDSFVFAGTNVVLSLPLKEVKNLYKSELIYISPGTESFTHDMLGIRYER